MSTQEKITDFIQEEFVFADQRVPGPDDPLLSSSGGVVDSIGLQKLILFVEKEFEIEVEDGDILPENFESIQVLIKLVENKL